MWLAGLDVQKRRSRKRDRDASCARRKRTIKCRASRIIGVDCRGIIECDHKAGCGHRVLFMHPGGCCRTGPRTEGFSIELFALRALELASPASNRAHGAMAMTETMRRPRLYRSPVLSRAGFLRPQWGCRVEGSALANPLPHVLSKHGPVSPLERALTDHRTSISKQMTLSYIGTYSYELCMPPLKTLDLKPLRITLLTKFASKSFRTHSYKNIGGWGAATCPGSPTTPLESVAVFAP